MERETIKSAMLDNLYTAKRKDDKGEVIGDGNTYVEIIMMGCKHRVEVSPGLLKDERALPLGVMGDCMCEFQWQDAKVFEFGRDIPKTGKFPIRLIGFTPSK